MYDEKSDETEINAHQTLSFFIHIFLQRREVRWVMV